MDTGRSYRVRFQTVKPIDELKELAIELVATCNSGLQAKENYNHLAIVSAQAIAKGTLLVHKLGSFGQIWAMAFEPSGIAFDDILRMLGTATEIRDAITKGRLTSIEERVSAAVLGDLVQRNIDFGHALDSHL